MFASVNCGMIASMCVFTEADSPPVALQGAQEQREDGEPGEAEEASG